MNPPFEFKLNLVAKSNAVVTNERTGEAAILGPVEVSLIDISDAITGFIWASSPAEDARSARIQYFVPQILQPDPLTGVYQNVAVAGGGRGGGPRTCASEVRHE